MSGLTELPSTTDVDGHSLKVPIVFWDQPPAHNVTSICTTSNGVVTGGDTGEMVAWKIINGELPIPDGISEHNQVFPHMLMMGDGSSPIVATVPVVTHQGSLVTQKETSLCVSLSSPVERIYSCDATGHISLWTATGSSCMGSVRIPLHSVSHMDVFYPSGYYFGDLESQSGAVAHDDVLFVDKTNTGIFTSLNHVSPILIVSGEDTNVLLVDTVTGATLANLPHHSPVRSLVLSHLPLRESSYKVAPAMTLLHPLTCVGVDVSLSSHLQRARYAHVLTQDGVITCWDLDAALLQALKTNIEKKSSSSTNLNSPVSSVPASPVPSDKKSNMSRTFSSALSRVQSSKSSATRSTRYSAQGSDGFVDGSSGDDFLDDDDDKPKNIASTPQFSDVTAPSSPHPSSRATPLTSPRREGPVLSAENRGSDLTKGTLKLDSLNTLKPLCRLLIVPPDADALYSQISDSSLFPKHANSGLVDDSVGDVPMHISVASSVGLLALTYTRCLLFLDMATLEIVATLDAVQLHAWQTAVNSSPDTALNTSNSLSNTVSSDLSDPASPNSPHTLNALNPTHTLKTQNVGHVSYFSSTRFVMADTAVVVCSGNHVWMLSLHSDLNATVHDPLEESVRITVTPYALLLSSPSMHNVSGVNVVDEHIVNEPQLIHVSHNQSKKTWSLTMPSHMTNVGTTGTDGLVVATHCNNNNYNNTNVNMGISGGTGGREGLLFHTELAFYSLPPPPPSPISLPRQDSITVSSASHSNPVYQCGSLLLITPSAASSLDDGFSAPNHSASSIATVERALFTAMLTDIATSSLILFRAYRSGRMVFQNLSVNSPPFICCHPYFPPASPNCADSNLYQTPPNEYVESFFPNEQDETNDGDGDGGLSRSRRSKYTRPYAVSVVPMSSHDSPLGVCGVTVLFSDSSLAVYNVNPAFHTPSSPIHTHVDEKGVVHNSFHYNSSVNPSLTSTYSPLHPSKPLTSVLSLLSSATTPLKRLLPPSLSLPSVSPSIFSQPVAHSLLSPHSTQLQSLQHSMVVLHIFLRPPSPTAPITSMHYIPAYYTPFNNKVPTAARDPQTQMLLCGQGLELAAHHKQVSQMKKVSQSFTSASVTALQHKLVNPNQNSTMSQTSLKSSKSSLYKGDLANANTTDELFVFPSKSTHDSSTVCTGELLFLTKADNTVLCVSLLDRDASHLLHTHDSPVLYVIRNSFCVENNFVVTIVSSGNIYIWSLTSCSIVRIIYNSIKGNTGATNPYTHLPIYHSVSPYFLLQGIQPVSSTYSPAIHHYIFNHGARYGSGNGKVNSQADALQLSNTPWGSNFGATINYVEYVKTGGSGMLGTIHSQSTRESNQKGSRDRLNSERPTDFSKDFHYCPCCVIKARRFLSSLASFPQTSSAFSFSSLSENLDQITGHHDSADASLTQSLNEACELFDGTYTCQFDSAPLIVKTAHFARTTQALSILSRSIKSLSGSLSSDSDSTLLPFIPNIIPESCHTPTMLPQHTHVMEVLDLLNNEHSRILHRQRKYHKTKEAVIKMTHLASLAPRDGQSLSSSMEGLVMSKVAPQHWNAISSHQQQFNTGVVQSVGGNGTCSSECGECGFIVKHSAVSNTNIPLSASSSTNIHISRGRLRLSSVAGARVTRCKGKRSRMQLAARKSSTDIFSYSAAAVNPLITSAFSLADSYYTPLDTPKPSTELAETKTTQSDRQYMVMCKHCNRDLHRMYNMHLKPSSPSLTALSSSPDIQLWTTIEGQRQQRDMLFQGQSSVCLGDSSFSSLALAIVMPLQLMRDIIDTSAVLSLNDLCQFQRNIKTASLHYLLLLVRLAQSYGVDLLRCLFVLKTMDSDASLEGGVSGEGVRLSSQEQHNLHRLLTSPVLQHTVSNIASLINNTETLFASQVSPTTLTPSPSSLTPSPSSLTHSTSSLAHSTSNVSNSGVSDKNFPSSTSRATSMIASAPVVSGPEKPGCAIPLPPCPSLHVPYAIEACLGTLSLLLDWNGGGTSSYHHSNMLKLIFNKKDSHTKKESTIISPPHSTDTIQTLPTIDENLPSSSASCDDCVSVCVCMASDTVSSRCYNTLPISPAPSQCTQTLHTLRVGHSYPPHHSLSRRCPPPTSRDLELAGVLAGHVDDSVSPSTLTPSTDLNISSHQSPSSTHSPQLHADSLHGDILALHHHATRPLLPLIFTPHATTIPTIAAAQAILQKHSVKQRSQPSDKPVAKTELGSSTDSFDDQTDAGSFSDTNLLSSDLSSILAQSSLNIDGVNFSLPSSSYAHAVDYLIPNTRPLLSSNGVFSASGRALSILFPVFNVGAYITVDEPHLAPEQLSPSYSADYESEERDKECVHKELSPDLHSRSGTSTVNVSLEPDSASSPIRPITISSPSPLCRLASHTYSGAGRWRVDPLYTAFSAIHVQILAMSVLNSNSSASQHFSHLVAYYHALLPSAGSSNSRWAASTSTCWSSIAHIIPHTSSKTNFKPHYPPHPLSTLALVPVVSGYVDPCIWTVSNLLLSSSRAQYSVAKTLIKSLLLRMPDSQVDELRVTACLLWARHINLNTQNNHVFGGVVQSNTINVSGSLGSLEHSHHHHSDADADTDSARMLPLTLPPVSFVPNDSFPSTDNLHTHLSIAPSGSTQPNSMSGPDYSMVSFKNSVAFKNSSMSSSSPYKNVFLPTSYYLNELSSLHLNLTLGPAPLPLLGHTISPLAILQSHAPVVETEEFNHWLSNGDMRPGMEISVSELVCLFILSSLEITQANQRINHPPLSSTSSVPTPRPRPRAESRVFRDRTMSIGVSAGVRSAMKTGSIPHSFSMISEGMAGIMRMDSVFPTGIASDHTLIDTDTGRSTWDGSRSQDVMTVSVGDRTTDNDVITTSLCPANLRHMTCSPSLSSLLALLTQQSPYNIEIRRQLITHYLLLTVSYSLSFWDYGVSSSATAHQLLIHLACSSSPRVEVHYITHNNKQYTADIPLTLSTECVSRLVLALDCLANGFALWQPFIANIMDLVIKLHYLSLCSAYPPLATAASRALNHIGRIAPRHFINALARETVSPPRPYFSTTPTLPDVKRGDVGLSVFAIRAPHNLPFACDPGSALTTLLNVIRRYPVPMYRYVPLITQVVVRCLDPVQPQTRKMLLGPATSILHVLVSTYPIVAFDQQTQRIAVPIRAIDPSVLTTANTINNTNPHNNTSYSPDDCGIVIYDLRTATKLRVLSGHTSVPLAIAFAPSTSSLVSYAWKELKFWSIGSAGLLSSILGSTGRCIQTQILPEINNTRSGGINVTNIVKISLTWETKPNGKHVTEIAVLKREDGVISRYTA